MEPLRVGLVGCGSMGREHLNLIARLPDARLVGVCDHYEPGAQRAGAEQGVPYWTDLEQFFAEAQNHRRYICVRPLGCTPIRDLRRRSAASTF
jgi:predicted dehydrogenase